MGAKVCVQVPRPFDSCRNAVLARVAGLLDEEDLDRCPWLSVDLGPAAAPSSMQWGMAAKTQASLQLQKMLGFEFLGMAPGFE